ncbi:MAG: hypothetical protein WA984_05300 [Phormidesmis sp.]
MVVGNTSKSSDMPPGTNGTVSDQSEFGQPEFDQIEPNQNNSEKSLEFHIAQQKIYDDLLDAVRNLPPVEALANFEALFFGYSSAQDSDVSPFLYQILFANDETEFRNTLKRACYILVNNWELSRHSHMVHAMLSLFSQPSLKKTTFSPSLKRLRQWLVSFTESQDFEELKLFSTQRLGPSDTERWSNRYVTYQLIAQYVDNANSLEQREAARTLSRQLKNKYKHDLAMYIAFSQGSSRLGRQYVNPTVLGDEVLRLIKAILVRRGQFSYRNVARVFKQQTLSAPYGDYKESLLEYLCFSIGQPEFVASVKAHLSKRLPEIYSKHDSDSVEPSLNLRTCNRVIDWLTTEDKLNPSKLFVRLLSYGNPLNLAVLLLKLVLISPSSQLYLEARLANLIEYYKPFMEAECRSIVQFLEICGVTFAIYSENVEYNLVQVKSKDSDSAAMNAQSSSSDDLDNFRIFSRSFRTAQKQTQSAEKSPRRESSNLS